MEAGSNHAFQIRPHDVRDTADCGVFPEFLRCAALAAPAEITSRPAGATPTIVCFIGGRKPPDASDCWASRSATTSLGMQLQAQSPDDLEDGIEARATLAGKRFIQALAGQPGISRNL